MKVRNISPQKKDALDARMLAAKNRIQRAFSRLTNSEIAEIQAIGRKLVR